MDPQSALYFISGGLCGGALGWGIYQRARTRFATALCDLRADHAQALERRDEQAELFRALFESAPECVKLQDRDGTVERMNAAGLSLLETTQPAQVLGQSVYRFIAPEYHTSYRTLTEEVFRGHPGFMEFELMTFQRQRRWLETHAVPLRNSRQQVVALLAITRDISRRKHDEQQLRDRQAELARVCRLSTLNELAAGLAHELNQPLCAISSYAESAALLPQATEPRFRALLEKIIQQAERANAIIQRLRDFARKRAPKAAPCEVDDILDNVLQLTESQQRRRNVTLELDAAADLPPILGDRVQLEQVLLNLLGNALQAMADMPIGSGHLSIRVRRDGPAHLRFSICDNGPGIPVELAQRLFTPFASSKPHGLGMGLSISRGIIESCGGRIWYQPAAGRGACFHFVLPVAERV